jgi:hypothetical protein
MTELWSGDKVAEYFGVSVSRARAILSKNRIERVTGYPAEAVRAIQRPGQGARTDLKENAMPGTQLYGWASYTMSSSLEATVLDYLGDYVEDYDVEGLSTAFRDAINELLEKNEIVLAGNDFYSRVYPEAEDSSDLIRQAVKDVDLGELAEKFDRS